MLRHGLQPLPRRGTQNRVLRKDEIGVGPPVEPAHPPPELVQVGEAEGFGLPHDERIGVRDVDAGLDDRGRHQDIQPPLDKGHHHLLQLRFGQLPVGHADAGLRHEVGEPPGNLVDIVHPIVHDVYLSAARKLPPDPLPHRRLALLHDVRLDRVPVLGRGGDEREVPRPDESQVERPGNRRSGERQHVHLCAPLLEPLLVLHAEALLLVHDQEAQRLEADIAGKEPVRPHDDVAASLEQRLENLALLGLGLKAGEHLGADREALKPSGERPVVLVGQDGGRDEDRRLPLVHHRLERGPDGDLGLAIADVAQQHPVHRARPLHVPLHLGGGGRLVRGLAVREGALEEPLPLMVAQERVPGQRHPPGLEVQQCLGVGPGAGVGLRLGPRPGCTPQRVERRGPAAEGRILLDQVELVHRHVEPVAVRVLEDERILGPAAAGESRPAEVAADAVVEVHRMVPFPQIHEGLEGHVDGRSGVDAAREHDDHGVAVQRLQRLRVEAADRGQPAAGELHAHGRFERGREEVENAAAQGELARVADLVRAAVVEVEELPDEAVQRQGLSGVETEALEHVR